MNFVDLIRFLFILPAFAQREKCNKRIEISQQNISSSVYCSSCLMNINEYVSIPIIQFELPTLTQLTGILVHNHFDNREEYSKVRSYFIEYRRTQDGPWRPYGQNRQRKLHIERRRLLFNDISNETRTYLPSIIVRQIRIIFDTSSSKSTCAIIEIYGCPSQSGLISTRYSQQSIINSDYKYDGFITNSTARGGLGLLTDGDSYQFIQWSPSNEAILLLFAFDSIKIFNSIYLDLKCSFILSTTCTLKINVAIVDIVQSNFQWTNRFRSITLENNPYNNNNMTITHIILSLFNTKGQFVIIEINTEDDLALSEVSFNNTNEYDGEKEQTILPSSIYIETNLRRLNLLTLNLRANQQHVNDKLWNLLIFIVVLCALLIILLIISCIFTRKQVDKLKIMSTDVEQSLITSITTTPNGINIHSQSQFETYSDFTINEKNDSDSIKFLLEPIKSEKVLNETAQATIRILSSHRRSMTFRCSQPNLHLFGDYLSEIESSEIIIIENLGVKNNHECFYSEYGKKKLSVILHEYEQTEFYNLSKLLNHTNIVLCFGYLKISSDRYFIVSEYSRTNLYEHCQTLNEKTENISTILMNFVRDVLSALMHLESINIIIRDLTLPNCLLFDMKTVKLSDYAKHDDRYASRYIEDMPVRWLPGDIVTQDETWSIHTSTYMFGTLLFELYHLCSCIPYNNLSNDEVIGLYTDIWSNSKQHSIEPSIVCFSTYFPRPMLCDDRLYALIERCLSWSSLDRPSCRELCLCLDETTTGIST